MSGPIGHPRRVRVVAVDDDGNPDPDSAFTADLAVTDIDMVATLHDPPTLRIDGTLDVPRGDVESLAGAMRTVYGDALDVLRDDDGAAVGFSVPTGEGVR